jgi:hypothetical protein
MVPRSGTYAIFHAPHLLKHEVTLLKEHAFPSCSKCVLPVHFDLIKAVRVECASDRFRLLMHIH